MACTVWLLCLSLPSAALAAEVLDQSYVPTQSNFQALGGAQAQTFSVGVAGFLSAFEVLVSRNGVFSDQNQPVVWEVRRTFNGAPQLGAGGLLASGSVPLNVISEATMLHRFDLPPNSLSVQPGDYLTLVLRAPIGAYVWNGNSFPGYDYGIAFSLQTGHPFPVPSNDFGFQTFVVPVPEPGTVVLLALGLGLGLAVVARRAQQRTKQE